MSHIGYTSGQVLQIATSERSPLRAPRGDFVRSLQGIHPDSHPGIFDGAKERLS